MENNESLTLVSVCDFKSVQHAINKNLTKTMEKFLYKFAKIISFINVFGKIVMYIFI